MADKEKKKKESILDLSKYIDKTIRVKFQGGREASGILKGFDPLLNLVLDGTIEYMRVIPRRGRKRQEGQGLPATRMSPWARGPHVAPGSGHLSSLGLGPGSCTRFPAALAPWSHTKRGCP
uniref:LSM7 homolog, U6 small nuclear RNA and mRNA degradation associated n=1 Tax=Urocitellus parryii TaxID=9999 RepID=A0A8D2HQZ8_UROPR